MKDDVVQVDGSDGSPRSPDAVERRQLSGHAAGVQVTVALSTVLQAAGTGHIEVRHAAGRRRAQRCQ